MFVKGKLVPLKDRFERFIGEHKRIVEELKRKEQSEIEQQIRTLAKIDLLIGPVCRQFAHALGWNTERVYDEKYATLVYYIRPPHFVMYIRVSGNYREYGKTRSVVVQPLDPQGDAILCSFSSCIPYKRLTENKLADALERAAQRILTHPGYHNDDADV